MAIRIPKKLTGIGTYRVATALQAAHEKGMSHQDTAHFVGQHMRQHGEPSGAPEAHEHLARLEKAGHKYRSGKHSAALLEAGHRMIAAMGEHISHGLGTLASHPDNYMRGSAMVHDHLSEPPEHLAHIVHSTYHQKEYNEINAEIKRRDRTITTVSGGVTPRGISGSSAGFINITHERRTRNTATHPGYQRQQPPTPGEPDVVGQYIYRMHKESSDRHLKAAHHIKELHGEQHPLHQHHVSEAKRHEVEANKYTASTTHPMPVHFFTRG